MRTFSSNILCGIRQRTDKNYYIVHYTLQKKIRKIEDGRPIAFEQGTNLLFIHI